jgi:hypothetical protein
LKKILFIFLVSLSSIGYAQFDGVGKFVLNYTGNSTTGMGVFAGIISDNSGAGFVGMRSRLDYAPIQTNDALAYLGGRGWDGTKYSFSSRGAISIFAAENWTTIANGTYINFKTTPLNDTNKFVRMTISANGFIGIGTEIPGKMLDVNGNIKSDTLFCNKVIGTTDGISSFFALSINTTLNSSYNFVTTTGEITVTLPTAIGVAGREFTIKKIDSNSTLSIATTSSQTIDGSDSPLLITEQWTSMTLISDGNNWLIK